MQRTSGTAAIAVLVAIVAAFLSAPVPASTNAQPSPLRWTVEIGNDWARGLTAAELRGLQREHVGTIVLNRQIARKVRRRVIALANAAGLRVVVPWPVSGTSAANVRKTLKGCSSSERQLLRTCSVDARSEAQAIALASRPESGLVVVRLGSLTPVTGIALKRLRSPILLLAPGSSSGSTRAHWIGAMQIVERSQGGVWLGVRAAKTPLHRRVDDGLGQHVVGGPPQRRGRHDSSHDARQPRRHGRSQRHHGEVVGCIGCQRSSVLRHLPRRNHRDVDD